MASVYHSETLTLFASSLVGPSQYMFAKTRNCKLSTSQIQCIRIKQQCTIIDNP